jgi:hypothetical protein
VTGFLLLVLALLVIAGAIAAVLEHFLNAGATDDCELRRRTPDTLELADRKAA